MKFCSFSLKKIEMSSGKWRSFCLGLNMLIKDWYSCCASDISPDKPHEADALPMFTPCQHTVTCKTWAEIGSILAATVLQCPVQCCNVHDDVIKWKHFPHYWPFVGGIHRLPVNSPNKGQWCGALMPSLIRAWTNGWVNDRDTGVLRRIALIMTSL